MTAPDRPADLSDPRVGHEDGPEVPVDRLNLLDRQAGALRPFNRTSASALATIAAVIGRPFSDIMQPSAFPTSIRRSGPIAMIRSEAVIATLDGSCAFDAIGDEADTIGEGAPSGVSLPEPHP